MFIDTLDEIRCYAYIQSAIPLATKNISIKLFHILLDSLRGNDKKGKFGSPYPAKDNAGITAAESKGIF